MFLMASGSAGKSCVSDADGNITSIVLLGFALTLVWVSNAIPRPPAKRSAAMAIVNGFGNIGSLYVRWVCVSHPVPTMHPYTGLAHTLGRPNGAQPTTRR